MKKINTLLVLSALSIFGFGFINKDANPNKAPKTTVESTVGINVGNLAPELKFKNPNGVEVALSSLRGKIVLIDFWASWCRPCRYENPNIVATYEAFKDVKFSNTAKGFAVYSVSLDSKSEAWINAIAKDGLVWSSHVSDLGGWGSKGASIYNVNSIPSGFLINENGLIVAKGDAIRGAGLQAQLNKLIVK